MRDFFFIHETLLWHINFGDVVEGWEIGEKNTFYGEEFVLECDEKLCKKCKHNIVLILFPWSENF